MGMGVGMRLGMTRVSGIWWHEVMYKRIHVGSWKIDMPEGAYEEGAYEEGAYEEGACHQCCTNPLMPPVLHQPWHTGILAQE